MPFLEHVHDPELVRLLRDKLRHSSGHRNFEKRKRLLEEALATTYGEERARLIMEEVSAAQPSTSLSVLNSSSFNYRDRKRPLNNKEFVLDLENHRNREALQKEIERLGGTVMDSMDYEHNKPFCIVSDYHRVDVLENPKKMKLSSQFNSSLPLILRFGVQNGVRIRSYNSFQNSLSNLKKRMKAEKKVTTAPVKAPQVTVRTLNPPFVKLEDAHGVYSPSFKEFVSPTNFRPIYLGKLAGKSIYHKISRETAEKRLKEKDATVKRAPRPKTQLCSGYCDICAHSCENLQLHYTGREHQQKISQPGFYDEVDALCGSYTPDIVVPNIPLQKRRNPSPLPPSVPHYTEWTHLSPISGSSQ